ncbi:nucleolar protein [Achlya hypogyna]|uniref:Bifunctional lysine-specific demethylase and histidyl-hydroxylase n=1 Tax=Achlya hypogyna TaxID=1202772 RepID=A0A1V9Z792_ACHHY|nr:nucleolar protein [Achlya hypogyna]
MSSAPSKRRKVEEKHPLVIDSAVDAEDVVDAHELATDTGLHSSTKAKLMFQWLIYPVTLEDFYQNYWERKPLVIKRHYADYYDGWFGRDEIDRMLREHTLEYGEDIDLTRYQNDVRTTLNPAGAATAKTVWKHFAEGCSVRLLCPQKFSDPMWKLLSILEEEWGCMAGSNTYLTPKGTQGFAPHYDDIEAFLLQVEGAKHWKVYAPLSEEETLPRTSSRNFKQDEIGTPVVDVLVEQGDLIYFPRGFIHQAQSPDDVDSLHVTVSTGQQNSYGNLLETLLPQAVTNAIGQTLDFRKSLPRDYLGYMGAIHSDKTDDPRRVEFLATLKKSLRQVVAEAMDIADAACDQMARNFLVDRLPPMLEDEEEDCTVEGSPRPKINVNARFKLLRYGIARMAIEDGKAVVYHCKENSRKHHENPLSPLEFELDDAESIEYIFESYPNYFRVGDLPHEDPADQIGLVKALYEEGLLMFEKNEA